MVSEPGTQRGARTEGGSLNPCCNGRWSLRGLKLFQTVGGTIVLILVVMEDGL